MQQSLIDLIEREKPDICCFAEVTQKSLNALQEQLKTVYQFHDTETKYGKKSMLRKIPLFKKKGNGILSRENVSMTKHFLKQGVKKLLYEVQIADDLHLFAGHFALGRKARKAQLKELKKIVAEKKRVILCGDFNIFGGFTEMTDLLDVKGKGMSIINKASDHTFPSKKPNKSLDLFICSTDIELTSFKVLKNVKISDHLPIVLEIQA